MKFWSWLRTLADFLFNRRRVEREMDEEFRSHLALRMADLERQGVARSEAERQARIEFGGYQNYKEECRETLGTRLLQELWQDLRYGLRQLRRNPGFTAVAVLTLALGIGANTAIFSVVDAVLLKSLPYKDPAQLVWPTLQNPKSDLHSFAVPHPTYFAWRDQNTVFSGIAATHFPGEFTLTGAGIPERIPGISVSANFFSVLGVELLRGRSFTPEEDRPGGPRVAILSYGIWQSHYAGDPRILGRTIKLDGKDYSVVGVLPASFKFPTSASPPKVFRTPRSADCCEAGHLVP